MTHMVSNEVSHALKGRYQTQIPTLPTFFSHLPAFSKNEILSSNFGNLNKRH